jgi:F-type H+-transporting ATPase subunit b|tara:strand:- start:579 stop:1289 length:711 start_codon:yes stop_codon:yes gene_type:complete
MRNRRTRLLAAPLLTLLGVLAFAGPAQASGESVGACMADHLEELVDQHDGDLHDVLHDEHVQDELEKCFEAPNPILPETTEIIWGGAAFLILFVVMVKKGFPAVKGAMDARAEKIRSDLDAADQAKADALAVQSDYEARLADAKSEASRLIDEARGAADQVKADLMVRHETEMAEQRERAAAEIESARTQAIADLRAEVTDIALGAAERVVQSSLDAEVQGRLIDAYIDEVAGTNG